jgi:NUMOD3 motif
LDRELTPARLSPAALARAAANWTDQRRAKIGAARRGRPQPAVVAERLRTYWQGRTHRPESRAKMSAAVRRRPAVGMSGMAPWTDAEIGLLKTLTDAEVAARTGRTANAARLKRRKLKRTAVAL